MARRGKEVWGVEVNRTAAAVAESKLTRVVVGDLSQVMPDIPDNYFDCIVANDVLEHVARPIEILTGYSRKLKQCGCIVASIPNVRFFPVVYNLAVKGEWDYKDSGVLDRTHLAFYTRKSILSLFEAAGFTVKVIQGINAFLLPKHPITDMVCRIVAPEMRYLQFACVAEPN